MSRVDRGEHAWVLEHVIPAEHGEHGEPDDHDRAEDGADYRRAGSLDAEESDEDDHCDRDDIRRQIGFDDLESFDGGEHRDCRCDDPVPVEKSGAEEPEQDQGPPQPDRWGLATGDDEGGEGQDAAFTVVVRPHHEDQILDRYDQYQGPEHEGEHSEDAGTVDGHAFGGVKRLPEGVQRAGPDVAVDDAQGAHRHHEEIALAAPLRGCHRGIYPGGCVWLKDVEEPTRAVASPPM